MVVPTRSAQQHRYLVSPSESMVPLATMVPTVFAAATSTTADAADVRLLFFLSLILHPAPPPIPESCRTTSHPSASTAVSHSLSVDGTTQAPARTRSSGGGAWAVLGDRSGAGDDLLLRGPRERTEGRGGILLRSCPLAGFARLRQPSSGRAICSMSCGGGGLRGGGPALAPGPRRQSRAPSSQVPRSSKCCEALPGGTRVGAARHSSRAPQAQSTCGIRGRRLFAGPPPLELVAHRGAVLAQPLLRRGLATKVNARDDLADTRSLSLSLHVKS